MSAESKSAELSLRLRSELKALIEEAATSLGLSVSAFAIATLAQKAHSYFTSSG